MPKKQLCHINNPFNENEFLHRVATPRMQGCGWFRAIYLSEKAADNEKDRIAVLAHWEMGVA
jgi:hypothetical protein